MDINTVRKTIDGGFFVNGRTTVPDDMGNGDRVMIQEWIDAGNTPTPYVEPEIHYVDKRITAYGSIGDQLDMQYRDLVNGTTVWKDHISKVKSDIAKE